MNELCYCDYEPWSFYLQRMVKAGKKHVCTECGRKIRKGDCYEYTKGLYAGDFYSYRTCVDCVEIREAINEMDCFCWHHEGLWEDIAMQFQEADFCPGLRFAYLRLIAAHPARVEEKKRKRK